MGKYYVAHNRYTKGSDVVIKMIPCSIKRNVIDNVRIREKHIGLN